MDRAVPTAMARDRAAVAAFFFVLGVFVGWCMWGPALDDDKDARRCEWQWDTRWRDLDPGYWHDA